MWIWGIAYLWIVGLLITVLIIGLAWHTKGFTSWHDVGKTDTTAGPAKGPRVLKPRTPEDCPVCRGERSHDSTSELGQAAAGGSVTPYTQVKSSRGRKKRLTTAGYACPNPNCAYFGVTDESIHALVHCGRNGSRI